MRLRESGMPDEKSWKALFDVATILDGLEISAHIGDVVELGCGYGTFTLPIAERIKGRLFTFDIDSSMVQRTQARVAETDLNNVVCRQRDIVTEGFGLTQESVDAGMLFNILHCEEPVALLSQMAALVHPDGWVWVIHWRYDPSTPRGPSMTLRPKPETIAVWAEQTGVLARVGEAIDLPPWHYGWRFRKIENGAASAEGFDPSGTRDV